MALFNLLGGGISFSNRENRTSSLGVLSDSKYASSTFRFPIDLGATDKGHYILININEQINTSFPGTQVKSDTASVFLNKSQLSAGFGEFTTAGTTGNAAGLITEAAKVIGDNIPILKKLYNGVNDASGAGDILGGFLGNVNSKIGVRTIRRISDRVALYMPNNLIFSYNQGYNTLTPGGSTAQAVLSGLNSVTDSYRNSGNKIDAKQLLKSVAPFLFSAALNEAGPVGQILFTAGSGGMVQNPMLEMLYSSPSFRSFKFDFVMFPRDEQEAEVVLKIIDTLRFHQAPELVKNSGGYFLYPPSEFDIGFYYNGEINPNIPRIGTCVLESIDTNYAPGGFAAYEVPGVTESSLRPIPSRGKTGMPVGINLSLSFKETEYIVKGSSLLNNLRSNTGPRPTDARTDAEIQASRSLGDFPG
jgi:hypothetical protein